jgi:hypothetical protein
VTRPPALAAQRLLARQRRPPPAHFARSVVSCLPARAAAAAACGRFAARVECGFRARCGSCQCHASQKRGCLSAAHWARVPRPATRTSVARVAAAPSSAARVLARREAPSCRRCAAAGGPVPLRLWQFRLAAVRCLSALQRVGESPARVHGSAARAVARRQYAPAQQWRRGPSCPADGRERVARAAAAVPARDSEGVVRLRSAIGVRASTLPVSQRGDDTARLRPQFSGKCPAPWRCECVPLSSVGGANACLRPCRSVTKVLARAASEWRACVYALSRHRG